MFFLNKKIKVAVHDGPFHPDDVFAVAMLSLYLNKPLKIFRTRNPKIISEADYVLDVGMEYSPAKLKFDHHQTGWNEKRKNGILYAASGLVWKEYGAKICKSAEVAEKIDEKIIQTIDAEDNGMDIWKNVFDNVAPYCFVDYIYAFNPTWTEDKTDVLERFEKAVEEAKKLLCREIKKSTDSILGKKRVTDIYMATGDKRIIVLDNDYSWRKVLSSYPEPLFVIKEIDKGKGWSIKAVNKNGSKFDARLDFPLTWAGKSGLQLAEVTGVSDAIFCHNKRFVCIVGSKEGAIKLAKLAIEENNK